MKCYAKGTAVNMLDLYHCHNLAIVSTQIPNTTTINIFDDTLSNHTKYIKKS